MYTTKNRAKASVLEKEAYSINVLTFNNIFSIVSKKRREKLTDISALEPHIKRERHVNREFRTSSGNVVQISGPVLDHFDATIASVMIALYFEKNGQGGLLVSTYGELLPRLQMARTQSSREEISRSINRLQDCTFRIYKHKELIWGRSIVKDFDTKGSGRGLTLVIELNEKWIREIYMQDGYSIQNLSILTGLSGEYQPALYRLITLEKEKQDYSYQIEELHELLSERGDSSIWDRVDARLYPKLLNG